jgi:hypothetical protein
MAVKKFGKQSVLAFMQSKFYRQFIDFAELVKSANISHPQQYIKRMVEIEYPPHMWHRDEAYSIYLEWMDMTITPQQQIENSITYLIDEVCAKENVKLENIFSHLGAQRTLQLVRQRRLSPWFLFASAKFQDMLREADQPTREAYASVINPSVWAKKFNDEANFMKAMKKEVSEMEL